MSFKKTKNKEFLKWSRAESCFRKDNIISTDWHERLEKLPLFVPSYSKCRPDMVYIMSMEYGRMWQKEKEEWYSQIFTPDAKDKNIKDRQKKIRREMMEEKRKAQIQIQERKERRKKEAEAKAKAEEEAREKAKRLKEKQEKNIVKKDKKKKKTAKKPEPPAPEPEKNDSCPQNWTPVELTLQCECAASKSKDDEKVIVKETKEDVNCKKESLTAEEKDEVAENVENPKKPCSTDCINIQITETVEKSLKQEEQKEMEALNQEISCEE